MDDQENLNVQNLQWFVLQARSGQEEKAMNLLLSQRDYDRQQGFEDGIADAKVPTDKKEERDKNNKLVVRSRKRYPGYVLVQLDLFNAEGKLRSELFDIVRGTDGIIGFVGGSRPQPLSDYDVSEMLRVEEETANTKPKPTVEYKIGDQVLLKGSSAFIGYEGTIESVDLEHQRLKVSVNIFGRATPTEVGFEAVELVPKEE